MEETMFIDPQRCIGCRACVAACRECATHKGYPTPEHCRCLKELGATPIHRRSFARVREALGLDPVQENLFAEEKAEAVNA